MDEFFEVSVYRFETVPLSVPITVLMRLLIAENTRAAYPIEYIPNAKIPCVGPHPKNVILLACDAFGVLPPVSKLSLAQTMYHFISGYTALVLLRNLSHFFKSYTK